MIDCQRNEFHLAEDGHYLNCAYMAPMARRVEEAGIAGIRKKRRPADVGPDDFFAGVDRVRALFARLIGAPTANRVALVPSVSYGIATAARNLRLGAGDRIVVVHEQFPSNVYTWQRLATDRGARMVTVGAPDAGAGGRGSAWNEALLDAVRPGVRVVAVPHVHWTDGTLFDLEAIGERARDVGAAFVVDGTQSVGALPFDVGRIRPDALVCAGYKWLLGPYSLGVAWYGPRFDDGVPLEENWIARRHSERFAELVNYTPDYGPGATRYDVGERSNFILVPMLEAALELLTEWTVDGIRDYVAGLTGEALQEAVRLGYRVEEDAFRAAHLFGIRAAPGSELERLRAALDRRRISVSLRGDAVRVAPHVYNDPRDLEALVDALREAR